MRSWCDSSRISIVLYLQTGMECISVAISQCIHASLVQKSSVMEHGDAWDYFKCFLNRASYVLVLLLLKEKNSINQTAASLQGDPGKSIVRFLMKPEEIQWIAGFLLSALGNILGACHNICVMVQWTKTWLSKSKKKSYVPTCAPDIWPKGLAGLITGWVYIIVGCVIMATGPICAG